VWSFGDTLLNSAIIKYEIIKYDVPEITPEITVNSLQLKEKINMKPENVKKIKFIKFSVLGSFMFAIMALLSFQINKDILCGASLFIPLLFSTILAYEGIVIWNGFNKLIKSEQD